MDGFQPAFTRHTCAREDGVIQSYKTHKTNPLIRKYALSSDGTYPEIWDIIHISYLQPSRDIISYLYISAPQDIISISISISISLPA